MASSALKLANLAAWLITHLPVLHQDEASEDVDMDADALQGTAGTKVLQYLTQTNIQGE